MTASSLEQVENENIEIKLLLEAIRLKYGYDFNNYSQASLKRRIKHRLALCNFQSILHMIPAILSDQSFFESLLLDFSINATQMFRDPSFYLSLKRNVFPVLKNYPYLKIWHAGCSTGEEVYSMVILLEEEDLYDKSQIYATDFNEIVLKKAKEGIYPIQNIKAYTLNYQQAGGSQSLSDYYTARYDSIILNKGLRKNILFSDHNLVTDWVFGDMNIIFCRNVLIYFNKELQNRVFKLFTESLCDNGFLCIGPKESLEFSDYSNHYVQISEKEKIYKKC